MPNTTAQIETEADRPDAIAEEARTHDDVICAHELEVAPRFSPEELDFSDYRWSRGDHRLERDVQMYEAGHRYRDFT